MLSYEPVFIHLTNPCTTTFLLQGHSSQWSFPNSLQFRLHIPFPTLLLQHASAKVYRALSALHVYLFPTRLWSQQAQALYLICHCNPGNGAFPGGQEGGWEAPIFWPPDTKNRLIGKDPDAGKDWRQEEKGTTEDEMVGWHHWLDGHEFEQVLGVGDGQGSLVRCSPWGHSRSQLSNWTELILRLKICHNIVVVV